MAVLTKTRPSRRLYLLGISMSIVTDSQIEMTFANIVDVEHAHAHGVFAGINKGLDKLDLTVDKLTDVSDRDIPQLVCVNLSGASVMEGHKSGAVSHCLDAASHVIPIHCVAHKLELAVLDAVQDV
jgi:hypothetical protein